MVPSAQSSPVNTINRRVLIVDDDPYTQEAYLKILAGEAADNSQLNHLAAMFMGHEELAKDEPETVHFDITQAYQGQEAITLCESARKEGRPFAMAFIDMRMPPGIDGLQTIQGLWETCPDLQVAICSAYSDYEWEEVVKELGHSDRLLILKKPFERIEVQQMAAALTEKWSLAKAADSQMHRLEEAVENRTRELQAAQKQLLQAEKMASIGQLAAGVAHEINNPIGFVANNLQTLGSYLADLKQVLDPLTALPASIAASDPNLPEKSNQAAAALERVDLPLLLQDLDEIVNESTEGTDRVRRIVTDLRDFSQVADDALTPEDLNTLIQQAIGLAENELKPRIQIITELNDLPPTPCYSNGLIQVFLNLLINAGQAIEGEGTIRIETKCEEPNVCFQIQDTGCGMSPEILAKIFDPFFTTKDVGQGTGLGLNVAYNIIQCHDGRIDTQSKVGQGTTIRVELPIKGPASKINPECQAA